MKTRSTQNRFVVRGAIHPWDAPYEEQFEKDISAAKQWLSIFPYFPEFNNKEVVDFGSGIGALASVAAEMGAKRVLGIEISENLISKSKALVSQNTEIEGRVSFLNFENIRCDNDRFKEKFDIILSQNSFEHYDDPRGALGLMAHLLRSGGVIYAGFGPLWYSPYGSHLASISRIPWVHLLHWKWIINRHNSIRPHDIKKSSKDLGLNQASFALFRDLFHNSAGLRVVSFCPNYSIKRRSSALYESIELFRRRFGCLREYLTISLYVILERTD